MKHQFRLLIAVAICSVSCGLLNAADPSKPDAVPLTRDEMKRALDASKESTPRLPLPPVTEQERAFIDEQKAKAEKSGEKPRRYGLANNGRMRAYYLPEYGFKLGNDLDRARAGATRDGESSLDPQFRTSLFWIVSRGNNCTYCLGHQESSLSSRGMTDDQLAALDGDWTDFDLAHRVAFQFTRKLSFTPYLISDADFVELRKHYNETQIAELILAIAGFNATNRWTGPLRVKQDVTFPFVRPTSAKFQSLVSQIIPPNATEPNHNLAIPTSRVRPELESRTEVIAALKAAKTRQSRLPLADAAATKAVLKEEQVESIPNWMRLLATLPKAGGDRIVSYQAVLHKGTLEPRTKAIIAYVAARQDRAWYALGHAIERLKASGFTEDQIFALDQPEKLSSATDREIVEFARTITVDPALVTDDDFKSLQKLMSDKKVAEVVYVITQGAFFDRLTEAAALPLE